MKKRDKSTTSVYVNYFRNVIQKTVRNLTRGHAGSFGTLPGPILTNLIDWFYFLPL